MVYFYTPWLEKIYLISGSNDLTIFVTETVVGFISKMKTHNSVVPILDFIESFFLVGLRSDVKGCFLKSVKSV